MVEAEVTINGVALGFSQAMTLRVAIGSFAMFCSDPENAAALGPAAAGYLARCGEIERLIRSVADGAATNTQFAFCRACDKFHRGGHET